MGNTQPRRYEEYAHVLDFKSRGKSITVHGRTGVIVVALGEERLTLLEILGVEDTVFTAGEKIYIGKDGRSNVKSVLGKISYDKISTDAKSEIPIVVQELIIKNEKRFVNYLNTAQPLTPRIHALELIPGIGKTYLNVLLQEREKKPFESYDDIERRVGLKEPINNLKKRILEDNKK